MYRGEERRGGEGCEKRGEREAVQVGLLFMGVGFGRFCLEMRVIFPAERRIYPCWLLVYCQEGRNKVIKIVKGIIQVFKCTYFRIYK
jgi:hypothetical protein